jgi:hypothetical protein
VDLNGDGHADILSGSYSRKGADMAGTFHVLWGGEDGFRAASELEGTDGEPLVIQVEERTEKICTRPIAVDLDGDGKLDIVSGNFSGTFAVFRGEGDGKFSPKSAFLQDGAGALLRVTHHSDPFFVDWDADGDLDLVSGSAAGGVVLFTNGGSKTEPKFGKSAEIVPAASRAVAGTVFGEDWVLTPQSDTRVWVDDVNGDGKLDLLIGDNVTLTWPAEGLDEDAARKKLDEWKEKMAEVQRASRGAGKLTAEELKKYQEDVRRLYDERKRIVREERTGFVWVMYRQ